MTALGRLKREVDEVAKFVDEGYSEDPPAHPSSKVIRDAVWDFHTIPQPYLVLLDSPFLQRLRHLSQTALTTTTYPCSQHSRLEHTLGVFNAASRMLEAIEKNEGISIPEPFKTETQLAALLHDTGHGPFSHASEEVYQHHPYFEEIGELDRFQDAVPSEILVHCLLESEPVQQLLAAFKQRSEVEGLDELSTDRISDMILGNEAGLEDGWRFLRYIINGPFDADKMDYINRDGYFTGLNISLDVKRLLQGLETASDGNLLVVNGKSLSALEQVFIGKAQLYSQVYHHHKIRASAALIRKLILRLEIMEHEFESGFTLESPATHLSLDEYSLLSGEWADGMTRSLVRKMKYRSLPRRALVLSYSCLPDVRDESLSEEEIAASQSWEALRRKLRRNLAFLLAEEAQIAQISDGLDEGSQVVLDVPPPPPGGSGETMVQLGAGDETLVPLDKVFPAEGWANAYEVYRSISYVFTDVERPAIPSVSSGALGWLDSHGARVNPLAVEQAKVALADVDWDDFLGYPG